MDFKKTLALAAAFSVAACSLCTGCSDTDDATTSAESEASEETESTVDIYLDDDGYPYYYTEDGTKMILYAYEDEEEEEVTYIYDEYDVDGLYFEIPDGWYVDDSYGAPTMFIDSEDDYNYDEVITILPTSYVFESDEDGTYPDDIVTSYFDELIEEGYYTSYELTDSGEGTAIDGNATKYYDITAYYETTDDDGNDTEEGFRTRYIISDGDNSYSVIINSLDTDDSFDMVVETYESMVGTIVLPEAEEETEEEAEEDTEEDTEEETEEETEE